MHIARVCERGSLVKLRGLMRIKLLHDLLTGHNAGVGVAGHPTSSPPTAAIVDLNREEFKGTKYRSNDVCVGRRGGGLSPTGRITN